jgi:hypothetical protein
MLKLFKLALMKSPSRGFILSLLVLSALGFCLFVIPVSNFRRWFPRRIIERLESPIAVKSWSREGIILSDGRILTFPGLEKVLTNSLALDEVAKRGLEISSDGSVYGLVRVWHWCGNDSVREHVARVDVKKMVLYLSELDQVLAEYGQNSNSKFSECGWNISSWSELRHR